MRLEATNKNVRGGGLNKPPPLPGRVKLLFQSPLVHQGGISGVIKNMLFKTWLLMVSLCKRVNYPDVKLVCFVPD